MDKPVLVIMAAGMGSRFGGMKQIEPVDEQGHIIMDFSIYDAVKAGFEKVIFIIRKEHEELFRKAVGDRIAERVETAYAFQDISDLPEGFEVPDGRSKPWGTAHAVLSARNIINGPFAVINADDYYGAEAFSLIYQDLLQNGDKDDHYAMVGYTLSNTLTENGTVARGCCTVDEVGNLSGIVERTKIRKDEGGASYLEDDEKTWTAIDPGSIVSMNLWGFPGGFMNTLQEHFPKFLQDNLPVNPLKCEYYLPYVVDLQLKGRKAAARVLHTKERWYGVTYREDKAMVTEAIAEMELSGKYPENF